MITIIDIMVFNHDLCKLFGTFVYKQVTKSSVLHFIAST